jgi:hypothetical protein
MTKTNLHMPKGLAFRQDCGLHPNDVCFEISDGSSAVLITALLMI